MCVDFCVLHPGGKFPIFPGLPGQLVFELYHYKSLFAIFNLNQYGRTYPSIYTFS